MTESHANVCVMQKVQEIGESETRDADVLLSDEVMALLRISRSTLDRWAISGRIPSTQPGGVRGTRYYSRREIDAWLRGGTS